MNGHNAHRTLPWFQNDHAGSMAYPVFVALFAWLLFREMHINTSVIIGGLLVFAGVTMIIWNNP
jgi:drug/metabolite transporter (DMT)-like permease